MQPRSISVTIGPHSHKNRKARMKRNLLITALLLISLAVSAKAQLTAQQAVKEMTRGINIGNSLEAYPGGETSWGNPPIQEGFFVNLKQAGFNAVRIPITWGYDSRTLTEPPYTIDSTFMARVDTVVTWALEKGLFVIINAHHEAWLKDTLAITALADTAYADSAIARFDSIWSQIAIHFRNKSDSLIFEILNEPYPAPAAAVNQLNAQVLKIIRRTNPTRLVLYSGYMWSNSAQLVTAQIPDSSDKYLIGYYHSYDPWPFGLNGGTASNTLILSTIKSEMNQATTWSQKTGIPVILGEYGFINTCSYNPRMYAYATILDQAQQQGVAPFAWDDGGSFVIFNRNNGTFNEIKDIIIHTYPQSPNQLSISANSDGSIKLQWHNRNAESDSIMVQRAVGGDPHLGIASANFVDYAEIAPTDSVFIDSNTTSGNSYYYRLSITMKDSTVIQSYPIMMKDTVVTTVEQVNTPVSFQLFNNYPNPFNPTTVISYSIPKRGMVTLKIFDMLGREVATLVNEVKNAGSYEVQFDGSRLASGVYFDRLVTGNHAITRKMLLLK